MFSHVAWTALLYGLLTFARAPDAWGIGRTGDGLNPYSSVERRISANLSNQFEWPVFFYAACLILMFLGSVEVYQVWLCWLFVIGRVVHSAVQISTPKVRLRGIVFTINFVAVLLLWLSIVL